MIGCESATGQVIPPFIIFAAKQISLLWTKDEVNGSRFAVSENSWVDKNSFIFCKKNTFFPMLYQGVRPLFLLFDSHSSHFQPNTIEFAKKNDIIIFCIPPHTTHECQPLDLLFEDTLAIIMSHILSEEPWLSDHKIEFLHRF